MGSAPFSQLAGTVPRWQEQAPAVPNLLPGTFPASWRMEHATWTGAILLLLLGGAIVRRIIVARQGRPVFVRRIAGLDELDDALGRATEMGRPIIFSPGFGDLGQMSTYAGLACLEYAVRKAAKFGIRVIVPVAGATMFPVTQDIVKDAYTAEGKPELYHPDDVLYLSGDQNAFAAAVTGIMERQRIGAAFYFGSYGFESLLLAETGQRVGAIQVAATDSFFQVPFFIAACDYTIIGEELYAAGAYLSREPTMLGSLSGQDYGKVIVGALLVAGIVTALGYTLAGQMGSFNPLVGLLGR